jgi:hypothetical protein
LRGVVCVSRVVCGVVALASMVALVLLCVSVCRLCFREFLCSQVQLCCVGVWGWAVLLALFFVLQEIAVYTHTKPDDAFAQRWIDARRRG